MFIATSVRRTNKSDEYNSIRVESVAGAVVICGWRLDDRGDKVSVNITLNGNETRLVMAQAHR